MGSNGKNKYICGHRSVISYTHFLRCFYSAVLIIKRKQGMMTKKSNSRYKYSKGEMEINRAFKMQKIELSDLNDKTTGLAQSANKLKSDISKSEDDLTDLNSKVQLQKKLILDYAKANNIIVPEHLKNDTGVSSSDIHIDHTLLLSDEKISKLDIPSWEQIMAKTDKMVPDEVILEDLLSAEEFQYCIEDVQRINDAFARKTKLNKVDIRFLMTATALQTARWIIIQQLMGELGETTDSDTRYNHNDKPIKNEVNERNKTFQDKFSKYGHRKSGKGYKSWEQIIFSSAPYDTTAGSPLFNENLEGKFHRYKTLGHDPILGWIFGTANFITDTCTLSNFNSYRISRIGTPHFSERTNLLTIFYEVFDSVKEDWLRLPAGVFAQFVHLKSDVFTKLGLPVPLLSAFSESLAGKLYRSQYDALCLLQDLAIVGNQAAWSIFINMLIGLIHGLFYNEKKDGTREHYEVRTRKILLYSNTISTSLNLAYVGANAYLGNVNEAWKKLDIGGLLVTFQRLFSDVRFITKIKEQFIQEEMDNVTKEALAELDSMFE